MRLFLISCFNILLNFLFRILDISGNPCLKYNGAIFLGLESPLVKSHGSTDSIGFAHSINVCSQIVKANLIEKIKSNLITIDDNL